jgi:hypothetical protein
MWGYDISLLGSTVQSGRTIEEAHGRAAAVSQGFPGRLVRIHDVDGVSIIAEYRNGVQEELVTL